ncbi:MAG: hypothetical protein ACJ8G5_14970 [Burkholderiales bacterium]
MNIRNVYTETLVCAAATVGGTARLAEFLKVPKGRLASWLAGEEPPPQEVFLDALDVIADGPYASPQRRRPRVAILQPNGRN